MHLTLSLLPLAALTLILAGCSSGPYDRLPERLGFRDAPAVTESGNGTVTVSGNGHTVTLTPGKRPATVDGVTYYLHRAPGPTGLGEADTRLLKAALEPSPGIDRPLTIVVDAGHGGRDSGCRVDRTSEKTINLCIANALADTLRGRGHTVVLTRAKDETAVTLEERAVIAASHPTDLFVSIHANAAANPDARGIEVYTLPAPGHDGTAANSPPRPGLAGHIHLSWSTRFALAIQKAMLRAEPRAADRGVRHAHFKVLRDTPAPAVLIETGYLTNADDRALLTDPATQKRLAEAVADGIEAAL